MGNIIGGAIDWPLNQFKNGTWGYMLFYFIVVALVVWILTSYEIVPACPRIGKAKE